jgi:hypothetical protein
MDNMKKYKEFINENTDYKDYDFNNFISLIKDDVLSIEKEYEELTEEYDENRKQITTLQFNRDLLEKGFDVDKIIDKLSDILSDIILQFDENRRNMILNSVEDYIVRKIDGYCVYLIANQIVNGARYKIKK